MNVKYIQFILILLVLVIIFKHENNKLYFSQKLSDWEEKQDISHILFTRFKEPDISQLLEPFINKKNTFIFIYNKGDDLLTGIPENAININIINIPNLGWDAYAYFYHVIYNYDNLPDYIYSLHASAQYLHYKFITLKNILDSSEKYYYGGELSQTNLNFMLDGWTASTVVNTIINPDNKYEISKIRPFNSWLVSKLNNIPSYTIIENNHDHILCNYYGMFKVHKSRILRYPLSFYQDIFNEISVWQSEVNHYLERSWYAFYGGD
jgi:hypothetical protein